MAETKMQLADWLDDLCVRFILNLPQEELESVERICFQVEEAQWFYEDFVRPLDPSLPSMNLRQFCLLVFQVCPFLSGYTPEQHLNAYSQFLAYKTRVPVRGVIMLNESMDEVVLVKGYKKGSNWSFPRGKINKDEADLDCAIREAYEETGFDIAAEGLVPEETKMKYIEVTMREQHMKLFVFRGIPQDTPFHPRTRKEISKISWWNLAGLPGYQKKKKHATEHEDGLSANKLYMVAPFLPPLKKWIAQQRKADARLQAESTGNAYLSAADGQVTDGDALGDGEPFSDAPPQQASTAEFNQTDNIQPELDAAAQMKRLLGVSSNAAPTPEPRMQSLQVPKAPLDQQSGNLLALLQGKAEPTSMFKPPKTPSEQMGLQALEPRSPTHHHQSHPSYISGIGPPPQFPIGQQQTQAQSRHQPKSSFSAYGPGGMYSSEQAFGATEGRFEPTLEFGLGPAAPRLGQQTAGPRPTNLAAQFNRQDAAPYQRTGDPNFARPAQSENQQGLAAPKASQLPAPRLSNHAMSLLSVFKGSGKTPAEAPQTANQIPARQSTPLAPIGTSTSTTPQQPKPEPPSRSNSLQAFAGLIPSNVAPTSRRDSGATSRLPDKPKPSSQQDTLLNLFRAGPPSAPVTAKDTPKSMSPQAVELSAQPSPAPPRQSPFSQPANGEKIAAASKDISRVVPKILQRPSASRNQPAGEVPVAASPKLVQEPESNSTKKKPHSAKQTPKKSAKSKSPAVTPLQILKRPTEPVDEAARASPPSLTPDTTDSPIPISKLNAPPAELEASQTKTFQPQILRRPPSNNLPSSSTSHESRGRKDAASEERKQSLLSLFNSQQPANPKPLASPLSASVARDPALSTPANPKADLPHSTIDATAPPIVDPSSLQMSRSGSFQSGSASRGPTSPSAMSPADRGFLLNYLEGVVKGAQR